MQKTLSIAAPTASLILFIAVAASSRVTLIGLGAYGAVFLVAAAALLPAFTRRQWQTSFPDRGVPRILTAMAYGYPLLVLVVLALTIINPFHEETISGGSWHEFAIFGPLQALGLLGMAVTVVGAVAFSARRHAQTHRKCPHCISRIPRAATRCKYCTAPVEAQPIPSKGTRHPPRKAPLTGTTVSLNTPRYLEPGHKEDFGRLSVPRPKIVTSTRPRPYPSEIDAKRWSGASPNN